MQARVADVVVNIISIVTGIVIRNSRAELALRRGGIHLDAWVLPESSGNKERVLGFDQLLFDAQAAVRSDAMAGKKSAYAQRNMSGASSRGGQRLVKLSLRVTRKVEVSSKGFDEQIAGGVLDKKGRLQRLIRHLLPFSLFVVGLPPRGSAIKKARLARNGSRHSVRADGGAVDLDQSQRSVANLRRGCAEQDSDAD